MRLTANVFMTLDGVMQGPGMPDEDRRGGFDQGGWQVPYADEDMGRILTGWFDVADAFLLGRTTYEIFAAYWPHHPEGDAAPGEGAVAGKLNELPKHVVSTTLTPDELTWNNSHLVRGDVVGEIERLKDRPGRELQVHGSGDLLQTLMDHDLVDEYRLWTYPVVLGHGHRLFSEGVAPAALELVGLDRTSTGAVVHTYRPAGRPQFGSFDA